jgi:hypothetical protein
VTLPPDGSEKIITVCGGDMYTCATGVDGVAVHGGQHPVFSAEGHWLVSGSQLMHRPSGTIRVLDDNASEALFTPTGDIIAGENNGDLVYFCRSAM